MIPENLRELAGGNTWTAFKISLAARYELCEDFAATPSSILLAVLNAVDDAEEATKP